MSPQTFAVVHKNHPARPLSLYSAASGGPVPLVGSRRPIVARFLAQTGLTRDQYFRRGFVTARVAA